ncbi:MAG: hypothetical protein SVR04_14650 [Spirochaetota bacterium]|nr:hypothetical protein [Spirochaetota bacterium]
MKKIIIIFLLLLCSVNTFGESRFGERRWRHYLEFDQMMVLKAGSEYSLSSAWGVKGGITLVGYELLGIYHLRGIDNRFQWDLEFGLPIAYFDLLEGSVVDWDPMIDDPYAGWAPGASLVWGRRFASGGVLCLKTDVFCLFEYQRDSGWWDDIPVLPELCLQWMFKPRD